MFKILKKLYVVELNVDYEGSSVIGVFDSIEKSKKAVEEHYLFNGWEKDNTTVDSGWYTIRSLRLTDHYLSLKEYKLNKIEE